MMFISSRFTKSLGFKLFFILSIFPLCIQAQQPKVEAETKPLTAVKLFFEKVYLHTDRELYTPGDSIWYKAYLLDAQSNKLSTHNSNLYVELVSPDSKIAARQVILLRNGTGNGDFQLSDSLKSGAYRLRVYTSWMLNFRDNFVFEKNITIAGSSTEGTKAGRGAALPSIDFFPEGGSLVAGVACRVAFKVTGADGKGMVSKGRIFSSKGDSVAAFASNENGMGSFMLNPAEGLAYTARGLLNGRQDFKAELPKALSKGFSLLVQEKDSVFNVVISASNPSLNENINQDLSIEVKHGGLVLAATAVKLSLKQTLIKIEKKSLLPGINAITLLDGQHRPQCERLVFIQGEKSTVTISTGKTVYKPKEKVDLLVKVTDSKGMPLKSSLSLSVTDAGLIPANEGDIRSYALLQSEVRGRIENPMQYFDEGNPKRKEQLELLLLTQGWRDFVWKRMADSAVHISHAPEQYININGQVHGVGKKQLAGLSIGVRIPGSKGEKLFSSQTDSLGRYRIRGLELYGNQAIIVTALDKKAEPSGQVSMDSVLADSLALRPISGSLAAMESAEVPAEDISKGAALLKRKSVYRSADPINLNEVKIKASKMTHLLRGVAMEAGYPQENFKVTPADYDYQDLRHYLSNLSQYSAKINPSADTVMGMNWILFQGDKGTGVVPTVFVNNTQIPVYEEDVPEQKNAMYQRYFSLPMKLIEEVKVRKILSVVDGPLKIGYLLYITTKPHALDVKERGRLTAVINGYYESRVFYSPVYDQPDKDKDIRATILWKPTFETNENGEAQVSFYNSSFCKDMRISLEGVGSNGMLISGRNE